MTVVVHDEYRERSRAVRSNGDYAPATRQLEPASLSLVAALGMTAGWSVLRGTRQLRGMAVVARETIDPEIYQQMRDRMPGTVY